MKKILSTAAVCFLCAIFLQSCSSLRNPLKIKNYVEVETTSGNFVLGLYEGTPKHRDNFLANCQSGIYDGTQVYNIVRQGDYSMGLRPGFAENDVLDSDFKAEKIVEAEFNDKIYPKRGAVGMKRVEGSSNPAKLSDATLFFIVDGSKKVDAHEIKASVAVRNRDTYKIYIDKFLALPENKVYKDSLDSFRHLSTMDKFNDVYARIMAKVKPQILKDGVELYEVSDKKIEKYLETGGIPMYEGRYTFFGEIVVGMDAVQNFSKIETGLNHQPKRDVKILSTTRLTKKDFKKKYKNK